MYCWFDEKIDAVKRNTLSALTTTSTHQGAAVFCALPSVAVGELFMLIAKATLVMSLEPTLFTYS